MDDSLYVLKTVPPLRVLVLAAATTLVGAVLLVFSLRQGWHVAITVLAAVLLVAGLAIVGVAFYLDHRMAVRIKLTDDGYSVTGTNVNHQGEWADVSKVTESLDHRHVTIYHGVVRRTHLLFPAANDQQVIVEVLDDIRSRLVAVKGG